MAKQGAAMNAANWNYQMHKAYAAELEARARREAQARQAQKPEELPTNAREARRR